VYTIGENVMIHIVDVTKADVLNLTAPNFSYNNTISGSTSLEFTLPELRSGTYYIEYTFGNFSSTYPFDVVGYSARILEASLDKEKYYEDDVLKLNMNIEANRNVSGLLKTWIYDAEDELIDEFAVNKTLVQGENEIVVCRTLSTNISGIHVIVYGFSANLSGHSFVMLASGAEYFDVEAEDTTPPMIDTERPQNPYPSISGTHNGTITPNADITVSKLYIYPCPGTGGHIKYAAIFYPNRTLIAEAHWNGYVEDWHNLSFDKTFVLYETETYYYTIITGSYPQIIHESPFNATGGKITCDKFTDANGRVYYDWIPAIRLWAS